MDKKTEKIVVIDDIKTDLNLVGKILTGLGYETVLCDSAETGYKALNSSTDLIIVDALMPGMTGFDFVEKLRRNIRLEHIPVIMVTSLAGKEDRLKAVEAGINDYITKPVDKIELKVRVSSILKMKSAQDKVRKYQYALEKLVERKTKDLRATLFKLQAVMNGINDIMLVVDREGFIIEINSAFERLTGKSEDELKVNLKDLLTADKYEEMSDLFRTEKEVHKDIEFEQWGNKTFSILVTPMENTNILMMRDITEKIKAGMQRDRFLSIISHELRTPLNGILVLSEILMEEIEGETFKEEISMILESAKNLENIVTELLKFVEIDHWDSDEEVMICINEIVKEVIELYGDFCQEKSIEVKLSEGSDNIFVKAVPTQLSEIIKQIVDNAVKFSKENSSIKIDIKNENKECIIIVKDNGIGIPADKLPSVFESFFQVQEYITRENSGLGLGLTIVKRLVETCNGKISIESKPDYGTEVKLSFPLAE